VFGWRGVGIACLLLASALLANTPLQALLDKHFAADDEGLTGWSWRAHPIQPLAERRSPCCGLKAGLVLEHADGRELPFPGGQQHVRDEARQPPQVSRVLPALLNQFVLAGACLLEALDARLHESPSFGPRSACARGSGGSVSRSAALAIRKLRMPI
jgi:hypothetical protein